MIVLTSDNLMDENSLDKPEKIVPRETKIGNNGTDMNISLPPHYATVLDLQLDCVINILNQFIQVGFFSVWNNSQGFSSHNNVLLC